MPAAQADETPPPFSRSDGQVVTHAHRGESGMAPENTAAAFELAITEGADFIETDVQLSADGALVIIHDAGLSRTTNVRQMFPDRSPWQVRDFTLAELKTLDAGSWYDEDFAGQRIPTLDEVLDQLLGRVGLNLELKSPDLNPGLAEAVAAELRRNPEWIYPPDDAQRLIIGSFEEQALHDFHTQLPDVPVAMISGAVPDSAKLAELAGWVDSFNPNYRVMTAEDATRVLDSGMALTPWTLDSPESWQEIMALGADGIITNYTYALENMLHGDDPVPGAETVVIEDLVGNVPGDDMQWGASEYVLLRNVTDQPVDVGGWYLRDAVANKIVIGDGYVIPAGGALYVHTGPGDNDADSYFVGRGGAVWNNGGDSAALHRADDVIVDLYAY